MEAIRWRDGALYLLDQTRLPGEEVWLRYTDSRGVAEAIRTLTVRGAPAIGIAAAYAYALAAANGEDLGQAKEVLAASRPTAVNLFRALDRMEKCALACGGDPAVLLEEAKAVHREDVEMNRTIGELGRQVVPSLARILTHCNAGAIATGGYGTVLGVVRSAHATGRVHMVYCDETRPLLQGARLTAWELHKDGIPATLITDSMAGFLMQKRMVNLVLVGCDRMAASGDFANKIGTYSLAVNASYHGIPFYTVLPSTTIDLSIADGHSIPIEERDPEEVSCFAGVRTAPEGVPVWNPAFDVTPHQLLTGIITEKGIIYPPFREKLKALFS